MGKHADGEREALARIEEYRRRGRTQLALAGLNLRSVPAGVRDLRNLVILDMERNHLTTLPEWIAELTHLRVLGFWRNDLAALPAWLADLPHLETLDVEENPRLDLPGEITGTGDAKRILNYYFRTRGDAALPLNEFKLILVGRGGVGKTSLVHRLIENNFKEFKRTPGIQITDWPVTIDGDDVRAHIWDFGGQEIMHGTHRFFMTERALYLVLITGREGTEDHDAEYWLSLVRSFAGDVPTIVLLHKSDDYPVELNRELLREKYGRNLVFIETDSKSGRGMTALREEICRQASALQGLKAAWPKEWRRIKEELPEHEKDWITFDDFRAFCRDRGVPEAKDQEDLADSLHALGLMLSYRHDETLRGFGVLNPKWVTKGIYQMLNAPSLREAGGKFTLDSFAEILPARAYPKRLHPFLLALMRKFQLSHPLDDQGHLHLIPELLTKEEPADLEQQFVAEECLNFIYRYDAVLPEGLLPRFIVDTYVHRQPKAAWRTGVVLERANCRALVRGDVQGRTVTIRVAGAPNGRRELLGIIRDHFERLHNSYAKLPVTEQVPVPGHPGSAVNYETLLKYERANRKQIAVEIGADLVDFNVKKLLDGVDLPGVPRVHNVRQLFERIPVFISYSHKDAVYYDQLREALVPFERRRELNVWADRQIDAGQMWEREIGNEIARSAIAIVLLSPSFLASEYAMEKEMPAILARQDRVVVPIVVRPCRADKLELGELQAILPGGKAVSQHERADDAWMEVTRHLDRVIARLASAD
ncbi:MAG TPA: COR domain-containing protein [Thermoanaerobaculia bacterium]|nr:COR domain-containing protein [Thermoanaerobaculia bacterium]